jgi:hypothetical protein
MSHANGMVKFKDGSIYHYEYDGTSDVCLSALYDTQKDMHLNWRRQPHKKCTCGNEEQVEAYSSYGGGWYFKALGCQKCRSIRTEYNEYGESIFEKIPNAEWAENVGTE